MSTKQSSTIRFISFPNTEPSPLFIESIVAVFQKHETEISTKALAKGLTSDQVLAVLRADLIDLHFAVEGGKTRAQKIDRPVFFGENGKSTLRYQIDAFHSEWSCGLEVEAGRAWMGNAVYRDLIQAMVMVQVDHLCLAIPNIYKFKGSFSNDYDNTVAVARALFGHTRVKIPYGLTLIGY